MSFNRAQAPPPQRNLAYPRDTGRPTITLSFVTRGESSQSELLTLMNGLASVSSQTVPVLPPYLTAEHTSRRGSSASRAPNAGPARPTGAVAALGQARQTSPNAASTKAQLSSALSSQLSSQLTAKSSQLYALCVHWLEFTHFYPTPLQPDYTLWWLGTTSATLRPSRLWHRQPETKQPKRRHSGPRLLLSPCISCTLNCTAAHSTARCSYYTHFNAIYFHLETCSRLAKAIFIPNHFLIVLTKENDR